MHESGLIRKHFEFLKFKYIVASLRCMELFDKTKKFTIFKILLVPQAMSKYNTIAIVLIAVLCVAESKFYPDNFDVRTNWFNCTFDVYEEVAIFNNTNNL